MSLLKKLFNTSKEEIWKQLSLELGGKFTEADFWKGIPSKVQARTRFWTVTIDTFTVSTGKSTITYTRIRAPYSNRDGFRFKIIRKNIFHTIGKIFGMQDIEVGGPRFENFEPLFGVAGFVDKKLIETGYPEFDANYIIQGNNEAKVREFFSSIKVRDMIELQPHSDFFLMVKDDEGWFKDDFPEGVDELYFQTCGVITDIEQLKSLYELFSMILNRLCHIGSAYENDPQIEL